MWNLNYKTQETYLEALRQKCEEKNVSDTDTIVTDFQKYFAKKNKECIGDMEVIKELPDPDELASQYENKSYTSRKQLMKAGSAGTGKRLGIGVLSLLLRIFSVCAYLVFIAFFAFGVCCVAAAVIFQIDMTASLPDIVLNQIEALPYEAFANYKEGIIFLVAVGIFSILISGTLIKSLRYTMKKYRNWVLRTISGCYRLPVSLHNIHSKVWRVLVYIFVPLSLITFIVMGVMLFFGLEF